MKKWQDLWAIIKAKIWTPSNRDKAIDAAIKQAQKMKAKSGEITIAVCIAVTFVLGIFFGKGGQVITRAYYTNVTMTNCTNCVVTVATNRLDVSGSGGVSIPVSGGGK